MLRSLHPTYTRLRHPSPGAIAQAFALNSDAVGMLLDYFDARFNPAFSGNRDKAMEKTAEDIRVYLGGVSATCVLFAALTAKPLRTNFYQTDADGNAKERVALKVPPKLLKCQNPLPCRKFSFIPPVLKRYTCALALARGGLRWSDRRADFRTEILGLVKAQQVKNSVIVPVGSKGGLF